MTEKTIGSSVVQPWVRLWLTWKEQTVLLCALRGTDSGGSREVKLMTRWMRSIVLKNAAPHKTFMGETNFKTVDRIADENPLAFDMLPVHFLGHLIHAFQIIGYKHPNERVRDIALFAYAQFCKFLHLNQETLEEMNERLKDEVEH